MRAPPQSKLLNLPLEVRTLILANLLVPRSRHLLFESTRAFCPSTDLPLKSVCQEATGLSLEVLRVCHQLLGEGLSLLYGKNIIETDFPFSLNERVFETIGQSSISLIRRLSLPADNDIDGIEINRDLVKGAKNLRLAMLLQVYSSELKNLQMMRLEFDQGFSGNSNDYDPYFEVLELWDEYEDANEEEKKILEDKVMKFAFLWTVLRACKTMQEHRPELAGHVYECVDGTEGTIWIVFRKKPLYAESDTAEEVGVEFGRVSP